METYNQKKFETVLHYIIQKCGSLDNVGKTVIWKMLYFSDFDYYERYEKHMTGEVYCKLPRGPAPSHFDIVIKTLEKEKKINPTNGMFGKYEQQKFVSLKEPDIKILDAEEIKVIDNTIQKLSAMNATQISAYSHLDTPWKATEDNGIIDYELVFYRENTTSVREYENDNIQS